MDSICPICHGTGFSAGTFCPCITGKKPDKMPEMPDCLKDIFGDFFGNRDNLRDKVTRSGDK